FMTFVLRNLQSTGGAPSPSRCDWYPCRMMGPCVEQDVFQTACRVRETSRRGYLAWGAWTRWHHGPNNSPRDLLQESLPRRWAHVQGVAARARTLALVLGTDGDLLEAAAWLHDIGYA